MEVEESVRVRYSQGARQREEALCCPVSYDRELLAILPEEIIERDYGCGDPSRYVRAGDTVLDLGSGGGKICYLAAQLTGPAGRVIGIDMNEDMLALARRHQAAMAARLGNDRVRFHKAYIQDLALDVEAMEHWLAGHPVADGNGYEALRRWQTHQRREAPLIADASVDLVISNCVLNLVDDADKQQLLAEIFRVLKPGGRVAISDIVSDRPATAAMKQDPELWSGCISGAFTETGMLASFLAAGFQGVAFDQWETRPWRVVDGIEFRSVTLTAVRPRVADAASRRHEMLYRGPFAEVVDDTGRRWSRGQRVSVTPAEYATLQAISGDAFLTVPDPDRRDAPEQALPLACCTPEPGGGGCC